MRVCIHIGAPKTGSSAIQYFLRNNRSKLKKHGYFYPQHRTDKNNVSGGHSDLGSLVIAGDLEKAADLVNGWFQEARAKDLALLISSEGLYGRISEVYELFQGYDVRILAYFRKQWDNNRVYFQGKSFEHVRIELNADGEGSVTI